MKPPSQKDIQRHILESMTAAEKPPLPLDIHGSGEFRLSKWIADVRQKLREFHDSFIQPFDYIRVSEEALVYIKGRATAYSGPPMLYGIPMVLKDSAQDIEWTAQGKRSIEIN